jgi:catechol-2,3-dioxygenase
MVNIERLNHAVLYVGHLDRATTFYSEILGFSVVVHYDEMRATFLRASESTNHHDLGLFEANDPQPPKQGSIGLYHLAWQVRSIEDLVDARQRLMDAGALTGESDHGATKSLYGKDPDGNEFEIMWMLPRDQWGDYESEAPTMRLDLEAEVMRYGTVTNDSLILARYVTHIDALRNSRAAPFGKSRATTAPL